MGELSHDEYDQERILKYAMGVSNRIIKNHRAT